MEHVPKLQSINLSILTHKFPTLDGSESPPPPIDDMSTFDVSESPSPPIDDMSTSDVIESPSPPADDYFSEYKVWEWDDISPSQRSLRIWDLKVLVRSMMSDLRGLKVGGEDTRVASLIDLLGSAPDPESKARLFDFVANAAPELRTPRGAELQDADLHPHLVKLLTACNDLRPEPYRMMHVAEAAAVYADGAIDKVWSYLQIFFSASDPDAWKLQKSIIRNLLGIFERGLHPGGRFAADIVRGAGSAYTPAADSGPTNPDTSSEEQSPSVVTQTGLFNGGSTCYQNALFQMLAVSDVFTGAFWPASLSDAGTLRGSIQRILENLNVAQTVDDHILENAAATKATLQKFWKQLSALGKKDSLFKFRKGGGQQDCFEFFEKVVGHYCSDQIRSEFGITFSYDRVCSLCGKHTNHTEPQEETSVSLSVPETQTQTISLAQLFQQFLSIETIEDRRCEQCEALTAHGQLLTVNPRQSIIVAFKLFTYSKLLKKTTKIQPQIILPQLLVRLPRVSGLFFVNATVVHAGDTPNSGHYWAYQRAYGSEIVHAKWHMLNDTVKLFNVPDERVLRSLGGSSGKLTPPYGALLSGATASHINGQFRCLQGFSYDIITDGFHGTIFSQPETRVCTLALLFANVIENALKEIIQGLTSLQDEARSALTTWMMIEVLEVILQFDKKVELISPPVVNAIMKRLLAVDGFLGEFILQLCDLHFALEESNAPPWSKWSSGYPGISSIGAAYFDNTALEQARSAFSKEKFDLEGTMKLKMGEYLKACTVQEYVVMSYSLSASLEELATFFKLLKPQHTVDPGRDETKNMRCIAHVAGTDADYRSMALAVLFELPVVSEAFAEAVNSAGAIQAMDTYLHPGVVQDPKERAAVHEIFKGMHFHIGFIRDDATFRLARRCILRMGGEVFTGKLHDFLETFQERGIVLHNEDDAKSAIIRARMIVYRCALVRANFVFACFIEAKRVNVFEHSYDPK